MDIRRLIKLRKVISCKWVCKIITLSNGTEEMYSARLIIKGYLSKKGVDYDQTSQSN